MYNINVWINIQIVCINWNCGLINTVVHKYWPLLMFRFCQLSQETVKIIFNNLFVAVRVYSITDYWFLWRWGIPGMNFLYLVLQVRIRTVRGLLRIRHENLKQALYVQYSMLEKSKLIQYYHFTITTRSSRVHREIVYNLLGRIQT